MPTGFENLAIQVKSKVLVAVRALAETLGCPIGAPVHDLIEKHRECRARPNVMAAYLASHERYGSLYRRLAE